ncbi:hypothetical protein M3Y94_00430400 [Aphelenchoides besseyi]|nr:hypothetical protein M3Y94_00430400 [Aphelenchoides besseyi]KAI6229486.1 hypothetical protein M3Y95_00536000 [Aphelenchoides besseyi]
MFKITALLMVLSNVTALFCFDSNSRSNPSHIVNCSENEVCYSEFYSVAKAPRSNKVINWHVDRFCVHREHCSRRGIGIEQCVNITMLDKVIQKTFRQKLNKNQPQLFNRLVHSEFCCCSSDGCNRLDVENLEQKYKIPNINYGNKLKAFPLLWFAFINLIRFLDVY